MMLKIIFSIVGNRPGNLVFLLTAFWMGCFTFNKAIVSLCNGSTPPPPPHPPFHVVWKKFDCRVYISFAHIFMKLSWYHVMFTSFQSLLTDFEEWLLLTKVAKTLNFSISRNSVLVQLCGLYFLKTLMASVAVMPASHVGPTLHIPWLDFLSTIHWSA